MTTCRYCTARVDNGLNLCELCQQKLRLILEYLPIYFRNLARWHPGRAGSRPVPGSRVLYDGSDSRRDSTGDRISDTLDDVVLMLTGWARMAASTRPRLARLLDRLETARREERIDDAQMVAWLCRGFDKYLTQVAGLDMADHLIRSLDKHETILCSLTESVVPGWYAGACRHCGSPTYVVPGLSWVKCNVCGVTTYARDHLDVVLGEARDWVAPPRRIAEALVALLDSEQSVPRLYERIKKWQQRDRIAGVWRTERSHVWDDDAAAVIVKTVTVGVPRYRLGDVLDVLLAEGATRTGARSVVVGL